MPKNLSVSLPSIHWKHDVLWAVVLVGLVSSLGIFHNWALVKSAFQGGLAGLLEKHRLERRVAQFSSIKTLTLESAYDLWQGGQTVVIDARSAREFQELHIPRAINLPPEQWSKLDIDTSLAALDKNQQIFVYCSQESCDDSLKLAKKLQDLGFSQVMAFTGGFRAWDEAGYPADTSL